jgi:hypothetical protein
VQISAPRHRRRTSWITAIFSIIAATQLVFAPALRLCSGPHQVPMARHDMPHGMAHMAHPPSSAPTQDKHSSGDGDCLLMRGCEAIAIATPVLVVAESDTQLPWPITELPRLESVDRAPDAPPPRA